MTRNQQVIVLLIGIILIFRSLESIADTFQNDEELIVNLPNGKLRGRDNGDHYSYESIPYAEPPIGALRFEAPQPYKRIWGSVFNATKEPVYCMQWNQFLPMENRLLGVEDCLTVNVYKPKSAIKKRFPVVVFIHGGCFMFGGAIENGHSMFMSAGQVILVKISYRLGPLGFLSAEDKDFSGNYGLKDQRLALKWTKSNIAKFGGDPENILVLGFSAGAASVHLQMLSPEFKNVAKVAASISGTALTPWAQAHNSRAHAFKLGKIVGCRRSRNSLVLKSCLKTKSAEDIVTAVREFLVFDYVPFAPFGPVIEPRDAPQAFLTQKPVDIIASSNYSQVPWLVSYVKEDGGYNAAMFMKQQETNKKELIEVLNTRWLELAPYLLFYKDALDSVEAENKYSRELKQRYLGESPFSPETYTNLLQMFTDVLFKNGLEETINLHRKYGSSPIYTYLYDNPSEGGIGQILSNRTDINFGTVHADDMFLVFSFPTGSRILREDEKIISNNFLEMFAAFLASDGHELYFGSCKFVNNIGKKNIHLVHITSEGCSNEKIQNL